MSVELKSNSALFRRAEQLKRWEDSETNKVSPILFRDKERKIKFSDGCVFLAACFANDTKEIKRLLKLGIDINTANIDKLTALHQACIDNNFEMVQFLVEHGCDVNREDNEAWTPLHATASCGFISIAKYLIENGANIAAVNNDGDLPVDIAESLEMKEYLSDVLNTQGIDCDKAHSEEERIMLEDAKQMLNSKQFQDKIHQSTGASALHVAAAKGYIEVMNLLIQAGADLNVQDNDGWTPLHAAAHWGQKQACAMLANNLANMDIQNLAGQTCFDVAEPELVNLLEEFKKKQASMQKDRPEIQAILEQTTNKQASKRRTSVTRMSNQEKSISITKDTKSERVQIKNLLFSEVEMDEKKEQNLYEKESLSQLSDITNDKVVQIKEVYVTELEPVIQSEEPEGEKQISLENVLQGASKENTNSHISEVMLTRPIKREENNEKTCSALENISKNETLSSTHLHIPCVKKSSHDITTLFNPTDSLKSRISQDKLKSFVLSIRKNECELQRKAHAKKVRETRRSTQGVLLEDIKSVTSKSNSPPENMSILENKATLETQAVMQQRKEPERRSSDSVHLDNDNDHEKKENIKEKNIYYSTEIGTLERVKNQYDPSFSTPSIKSEVSSFNTSCYSSFSTRNNLNNNEIDYKKLYEKVKKENEMLKETLKNTEKELEITTKQFQKLQCNSDKSVISETEKREKRHLERKLSEIEEELKEYEKIKADCKRLKDENCALIRVISKLSQ